MTQEITAVIQINPQTNQIVIALYEQALRLEDYAKALTITSDNDVKVSTDDLSLIAKLKKAIEEKRKEYVGPINEHLKSVNDAFKNFAEPLNQADSITRQKILNYRKEQERIRQEQERINQLRMEAAQAEMELKGELAEPVGIVEVKPELPKHYRTETGTLGTVPIKKWEVVDFKLVPDEYKIIDTTKVGKVVRAGVPSIPGIRIWEEETLRITPK
ncbi:MAG: hypothetical protein Q7J06_00715 [Bacteroidales bacterium]|nr:hypothetical protein [Bacteroidales bacterium]